MLQINLHYVKEEDKSILVKEMKGLCYVGILKEGSSVYSSPVMLISKKVPKDKRASNTFQTFKCKNSKE